MKPRRTHTSNVVYKLASGNEDNDLWAQQVPDPESPDIPWTTSVWEPSDEEREAIAEGANIELIVRGATHPPVGMQTTTVPLGKRPDAEN